MAPPPFPSQPQITGNETRRDKDDGIAVSYKNATINNVVQMRTNLKSITSVPEWVKMSPRWARFDTLKDR